MKQICLILVAVFVLAAPAIADQDITCTVDGNTVTVHYDGNGDIIRAFGLDISVDNGTTIESVGNFDPNYYVAPGTYNYAGGVVTWGNPIADGGVDANYMTIEMGSLWATNDPCGHTTQPLTSGILLTFDIKAGGASDCTVTIEENGARGGIVMETGTENPTLTGTVVTFGYPYPPCWDYLTICNGDGTGDGIANTSDWPALRDALFKNYWDHPGVYNPCGDFNRDGFCNTTDWPALRDNLFQSVPANCMAGDINGVYAPGSVKP